MKTIGLSVAVATLFFAPVAFGQAGGPDDLINELTRDLNPAARLAGGPAARAEAPVAVELAEAAPIRARTAPAASPVVPRTTPKTHQPTGTPLAEATSKRGTTPLGSATRDEKATSDSASSWAMVGLSLIALFAVAVWLKRRPSSANSWSQMARSGSGQIETLSTSRIFGKHMVGLVRVGGRVLVVGYSDKGLTLLTELDENELLDGAPEAPLDIEPVGRSFVDKIAAMRKGWKEEASRPDPFQEALANDAPVDELVRLDERAAIRERLEALRRRSIAVA